MKIDDKYGYIDKKGEIAIEAELEDAGSFSNGLAYAAVEGKYGYISKNLKKIEWAINPSFQTANDFHNGLALVNKDQTWFYINKRGNKVSNLYIRNY